MSAVSGSASVNTQAPEIPIPPQPWLKSPVTSIFLISRVDPSVRAICDFIAWKAAQADFKAQPSDSTRVHCTREEFMAITHFSESTVNHALGEARRMKLIGWVGSTAEGQFWILPKNWAQGHPDDPSGLPREPSADFKPALPKPPKLPRHQKCRTSTHDPHIPLAAMRQPYSDQSAASVPPDVSIATGAGCSASLQPFATLRTDVGRRCNQSIDGEEDRANCSQLQEGRTTGELQPDASFMQGFETVPRGPSMQPDAHILPHEARILAATCRGNGTCPYYFRNLNLEENLENTEKLASVLQPDTNALNRPSDKEIEELKRDLQAFQAQGDPYQRLGPIHRQTIINLLNAARNSIAPALIVQFLARKTRDLPVWKHWGGVVHTIREEFYPWLEGVILSRDRIGNDPGVVAAPLQRVCEPQTDEKGGNLWTKIKRELKNNISVVAYDNWLMRTRFDEVIGGELHVLAPDQVTIDWIEQEYSSEIQALIVRLQLPVDRIVHRIIDGS